MSENRQEIVFVTDGKGNKIFNKDGLVLVQNTANQTVMYVKLLEGLINKPCKQPLKEQNSTFLSPSNTQVPSSQVQSTVQWQGHHHIEAVATSILTLGPRGILTKKTLPTIKRIGLPMQLQL